MRKILWVLLWVTPLVAAEKSLDDYWEESGLGWQDVSSHFSNDQCVQTPKTVVGCILAVRAGLAPTTTLDFLPTGALEILETDPETKSKPVDRVLAEKWRARKDPAPRFDRFFNYVVGQRHFRDNEASVTAQMFNAFLREAHHRHSRIVPAAWHIAYRTDGASQFVGIGVEMNADLLLTRVYAGGPAKKAGALVGDRVQHINGHSLEGLTLEQASALIRGPTGSQVLLSVLRHGVPKHFSVRRESIVPKAIESKALGPQGEIAYLGVHAFDLLDAQGRDIYVQELERAFARVHQPHTRGVILDLRNNRGGTQSERLAGLFLPPKSLVVRRGPFDGGEKETVPVYTDQRPLTALPLIVLVGRETASAAEVTAAALQDHRRAVLIGEKTYGKGTGQKPTPLLGGKVLFYKTVAKNYRPSGGSFDGVGVEPDIQATLEEGENLYCGDYPLHVALGRFGL